MSEDTSTPSYPPLSSCILIDSRMGSRVELRSYISSTHLFENLVEPESIKAGLKMVTTDNIDTCIFGPSVNKDNIKSFLDDLNITEQKSECAFLLAHNEGEEELISGIHSQILFPCTRQQFNTAVIQALQNANGGTLPTSKRKNPLTGEDILLNDALGKLEFIKEGSVFVPTGKITSEKSNSSFLLVNTFRSQASELANALLSVQPHTLLFKTNGSPSTTTSETMKTLVNSVFPNELEDENLNNFKSNLEILLYKWINRANQSGRKAANAKLRQEIIEYFIGN